MGGIGDQVRRLILHRSADAAYQWPGAQCLQRRAGGFPLFQRGKGDNAADGHLAGKGGDPIHFRQGLIGRAIGLHKDGLRQRHPHALPVSMTMGMGNGRHMGQPVIL